MFGTGMDRGVSVPLQHPEICALLSAKRRDRRAQPIFWKES